MGNVYYKKIVLPPDTILYINMLMHMKDGMGEDDTISHTAVFDNGFEMDIKLCGADDDYPWAEAVLFDENGGELCHTDVEEEYFGVWELDCDGDTYIAEIGGGMSMARYDVWFSIAHPANLVIEAESPEEAKNIAQSILENMDQKELMRKLREAMDFDGLKIDSVEEIV